MAETNEPRALTAALAGPAFVTRGVGIAMHAANRHVERWAPEATANRNRAMRSLGFVNRLVAPWMETAQRSASMRLFGQYSQHGFADRRTEQTSWLFPRPWYQDELDWMAAAREAPVHTPAMLTTRGTYVAPAAAPVMASSLYEFVAPSLSVAAPTATASAIAVPARADAYSPLIPLAAVQAAELMSRAVAPALAAGGATARMTPALRGVLSAILERATLGGADAPATRVSGQAPELITPPAPRPADLAPAGETAAFSSATALAERYAAERMRITEIQRVARHAAERELAQRAAEAAARAATATTPTTTAPATGDTEARAIAQRTEEQPRLEAARAAATEQERARIEDRIAQRIAERTGEDAAARARQEAAQRDATSAAVRAQQEAAAREADARRGGAARLHEQARAEAAAHARVQPMPAGPREATEAREAPVSAPAEVTAALAALPPELASYLGRRPERAMEAITELGESLRAVELMARGAASGATFEATRGPRLVMPAGLGGLVAAVDRATALGAPTDRGAALAAPAERMLGRLAGVPPAAFVEGERAPTAGYGQLRAPTLPWLAPRATAPAPSTALGATAAHAPAALAHVAWADRWLARFAGASQQSLDLFSAGAGSVPSRMLALAAAAPDGVFVAPIFDSEPVGRAWRGGSAAPGVQLEAFGHAVALPGRAPAAAPSPTAAAAPTGADLTLLAPPAAVERYDDNAETPDDVFASMSAAASRARHAAPATAQAAAAAAQAAAAVEAVGARELDRPSIADALAHTAPAAPNAGFAAQLASSPFAAALRHLLPLARAATFDVRALFGDGVATAYLAGMLAPETHAIELASGTLPSWAGFAGLSGLAGAPGAPIEGDLTERTAPAWDATYVAPEAAPEAAPEELAGPAARLTTLRSALLSWQVATDATGAATFAPPAVAGTSIAQTAHLFGAPALAGAAASTGSPIARGMLDAMALPMLGESAAAPIEGGAWAAPGMVGNRAHSWSVAQERSASDLALDFVTPELVLAARVYGLGPADAAQALRLALAGPGQLTAMASAVDRTFVQAMAIEADRRERLAEGRGPDARGPVRVTTAYPVSAAEAAAATTAPTAFADPGTAFGVERRMPRGAYLWPSATVGALGLEASTPDGEQSMSVAALELLAAHAVAALGTYTALGALGAPAEGVDDTAGGGPAPARGGLVGASAPARPGDFATGAPDASAAVAREPSEADVLGAAGALVPSARRAKFDALYLALGQSTAGAGWSHAARAARALALAGRGDEAVPSVRERASLAWEVLPAVYATEGLLRETGSTAAPAAGRAPAARGPAARALGAFAPEYPVVDVRPGLGALSSRAGEALGSYLSAPEPAAPAASAASAPAPREVGAVHRAPTAMQELVRTGRPAGRHGGGEVEIPPWFEAAARRMFEQDSTSSSSTSDFSLADLTLVTAAPSTHIAASTRVAPAAAPIAPGAGSVAPPTAIANIDVEKLANEIYRHIVVMMDVARARNGEPFL